MFIIILYFVNVKEKSEIMYYCKQCNRKFHSPLISEENHSLTLPPFEKLYLCPFCSSQNFKEIKAYYCRCCGAKIINSSKEFCSDGCKIRFEKLQRAEYKRKKQIYESPLNILIRELESYNKAHKTNYSYGQYVAVVKPSLKGNKKCKTKKNI